MLVTRDRLIAQFSRSMNRASRGGETPQEAAAVNHGAYMRAVKRQLVALVQQVMGTSGQIDWWTATTWLQLGFFREEFGR